jgi:signal peptidase I
MSPTFESGTVIVTSRLAPEFKHGDVVVFVRNGETLVKRVAFLPGDRILELGFRGRWLIPQNDFLLSVASKDHYAKRHTLIHDGQLYVLGDNEAVSLDSRSFGPIPISSVLGKVLARSRPELVDGFAGSSIFDDRSSRFVTRSVPLPTALAKRAEAFLARRDTPRIGHANLPSE